ncbi:MAG: DUF1611 domain-containing protein [Cyclobacteriaceae bacterium]|nr:DUF1611 domain-containing protein [Cyclobacteriaceae bacterium]
MDQPHISGTAVVITGGLLDSNSAKTAHGLIRVSDRFQIVGILDEKHAGKDAGEVLDGKNRNLPIEKDINDFIAKHGKPKYAIIGMATKGGILPKEFYPGIKMILSHGIHLVNGLHEPLAEIQEFKDVAYEFGDIIYDIRKSKPFRDLHFWTGKVKEITSLRIGVLGTDCALGKRTTSRMLEDELTQKGHKAEMIYTGQTGWMQGAGYGFLFDATPNDFISGEIEHALYECWKNNNPEVLIVEGQSGLRNPSGPCGSEFIISGALDGVILQHSPIRVKFKGMEDYPSDIPDILDEVELIEKLGSKVIALSINTHKMEKDDVEAYRKELSARTSLPIVFPFFDPLDGLVKAILSLKK